MFGIIYGALAARKLLLPILALSLDMIRESLITPILISRLEIVFEKWVDLNYWHGIDWCLYVILHVDTLGNHRYILHFALC